MEERLREMFRQEMSAEQEPPLGGLVEGAVREGRHRRRQRRAWLTAGVTGAAAALAVTAFAVMPGNADRSAGTAATATAGTGGTSAKPIEMPAPQLAADSTSTVIKQPRGSKLPVTDAAVVEQLIKLLPKGRTSGYAKGPQEKNRYAFGQVYLDTGKGPGMVRAFVYKGGLSAQACSTKPSARRIAALKILRDRLLKAAKTDAERTQAQQWFTKNSTQKLPGCRDLAGGGRALVDMNSTGGDVVVDHGNGVTVDIMTTDWLAWNGKENSPGIVVLTPDQALKIAANPAWGAKMDAALVKKAATDYPSLPTVN
ncbi:hypothetical protein [Actinoallomurus rhizosphaericola]|uniref:hypothetical protein n=1 Tax=Actinoallomurus rhizosphaericola TaxID=2952536 RepID=UPI0020902428|nr:hypothetical protein [Actinoallomurus rhizosphaericola]MCO5992093.1 hypothetical protein [Actinoallomurus rhizosphaericola]